MKATNLCASVLLLGACGSVTPSSGDDEPSSDASIDSDANEDISDAPDAPSGDQLPLLANAPVPSTIPTPLSAVSYATGPALVELVRPTTQKAQFSIVEQRIVPTIDEPLTIKVQVTPPGATYARSIATFYEAPITAWFPVQFLCSENNVSTNDPRCSMQAPVAALANADGEVTAARWRVYVIDAQGADVDGCIESDLQVECVLSGGSDATYTIVVAADGFGQLWPTGTTLQQLSTLVGPMTGAHLPERVVCTHFAAESGSSRVWCDAYDTYIGYVGFDAASISIDPIQLTITSGTANETFTSPAVTWNPGNNNLPGDPY
jgi:hypothetical protein